MLGAEIRGRGVSLQVIQQGIDTSTMEAGPCSGCVPARRAAARADRREHPRRARCGPGPRPQRRAAAPRLSPQQAKLAQQLHDAGEHTVAQIGGMFGVPSSTVYGYLSAPNDLVHDRDLGTRQ